MLLTYPYLPTPETSFCPTLNQFFPIPPCSRKVHFRPHLTTTDGPASISKAEIVGLAAPDLSSVQAHFVKKVLYLKNSRAARPSHGIPNTANSLRPFKEVVSKLPTPDQFLTHSLDSRSILGHFLKKFFSSKIAYL